MRSHRTRFALAGAAALALLATMLLALFDWATGVSLLAALVGGWLIVLGVTIGGAVYRRHRGIVLGAGAVVAIALLVVLRPDGSSDSENDNPTMVSAYGAELWPNRLASGGAFIMRERIVSAAGEVSDGRANLDPIATGPLMRELRFAPGAGSGGLGALDLTADGEATIVVNPIEDADVHHARAGSVSRVELPIGPVVRVQLDRLPDEARIAYLVGAGRSLAPLASLVTPLRRVPRVLSIAFFVLIGALCARAWADQVVTPLGPRFSGRPKPRPGTPAGPGPVERAPLVPRRK